MAPNSRDPNKALVAGWVQKDLKAAFQERAAADGITETAALAQALEMWLNAEKRPPAEEAEGRSGESMS